MFSFITFIFEWQILVTHLAALEAASPWALLFKCYLILSVSEPESEVFKRGRGLRGVAKGLLQLMERWHELKPENLF